MPSPIVLASVQKLKKAKKLQSFLKAWFVQNVPKSLKQKEMNCADCQKNGSAGANQMEHYTPSPGYFA